MRDGEPTADVVANGGLRPWQPDPSATTSPGPGGATASVAPSDAALGGCYRTTPRVASSARIRITPLKPTWRPSGAQIEPRLRKSQPSVNATGNRVAKPTMIRAPAWVRLSPLTLIT